MFWNGAAVKFAYIGCFDFINFDSIVFYDCPLGVGRYKLYVNISFIECVRFSG